MSADFSQYTFIQGLERKWPLILSELQLLLLREVENRNNHFDFWHERGIYEGQWKVFGLYAFGEKLTQNCDLCPVTTEIVESIPGMTTAGFSAMKPNTRIMPHRGYTSDVLRCHLGLIVPEIVPEVCSLNKLNVIEPLCALRVGSRIYQWQQGKAFVFDDTETHEAWNASDQSRYILLIDFLK